MRLAWAFRYHGVLPENFEAAWFGLQPQDLRLDLSCGCYRPHPLSGFALIVGRQVGLWIGVVAGAILAISAIWWMPYYPIWSLAYIAVGVLVIYALSRTVDATRSRSKPHWRARRNGPAVGPGGLAHPGLTAVRGAVVTGHFLSDPPRVYRRGRGPNAQAGRSQRQRFRVRADAVLADDPRPPGAS